MPTIRYILALNSVCVGTYVEYRRIIISSSILVVVLFEFYCANTFIICNFMIKHKYITAIIVTHNHCGYVLAIHKYDTHDISIWPRGNKI